jgi:hypothetical protein
MKPTKPKFAAGMKTCCKCGRIFKRANQYRLVLHDGKFAYRCRWYCQDGSPAIPPRKELL